MKLFIIFTVFIQLCSSEYSDRFWEELVIKPLHNELLYTHFQFTTVWDVDRNIDDLFQTRLFPRALSEIISRFNVQELHISLTAGLWRHENWGYPVVDAAPGAEVWVWFKEDTSDVDKNWKYLTNSLSGLICASLNQMDSKNTISPKIGLRPKGVVKDVHNLNSTFLRYSSLPREIVCTENLTPWKKLLPCDSKMGLATLLNAGYIHNTRYHSLGIHLRPICRNDACVSTSLELKQTVDLVHDYLILKSRDWSLRKLFGQGMLGSCPLAETSTIYVDTSVTDKFTLTPEPNGYVYSIRGGQENKFAVYDVNDNLPINVAATYVDKVRYHVNIPPPIYANQYRVGYGQQKGGLVTKIYNNHWAAIDVVMLQNIPWYVPIYLHTLKITTDDREIKPTKMIYTPGKLREKPHHLEMVLKLRPKSITTVKIDFDFVFLKWQEYPPDANHGFYIGSSIISAMLPLARNFTGLPQSATLYSDSFNSSRSSYLVEVRTETIVITLPTPDFSMPYNVICLACTVVALAFGPLHNITTKRLVLRVKKPSPIVKLGKRLSAAFGKIRDGIAERIVKPAGNTKLGRIVGGTRIARGAIHFFDVYIPRVCNDWKRKLVDFVES